MDTNWCVSNSNCYFVWKGNCTICMTIRNFLELSTTTNWACNFSFKTFPSPPYSNMFRRPCYSVCDKSVFCWQTQPFLEKNQPVLTYLQLYQLRISAVWWEHCILTKKISRSAESKPTRSIWQCLTCINIENKSTQTTATIQNVQCLKKRTLPWNQLLKFKRKLLT